MTDSPAQTPTASDGSDGDRILAVVNYVLLLLGLANGLTALVAVILAYIRRGAAEPWLHGHFTYQIYTFWFGLLFFLLGLATIWIFGLGALFWLFGTVLLVVRCIVGLVRIADGRAHPDPRAFLF